MQLVASGSKRRVLRLIGHKPVFEFAKQLRVLGVPRVGQPVLAAREVASSQLDQRAMGLLGGDEFHFSQGCVFGFDGSSRTNGISASRQSSIILSKLSEQNAMW